MNAPLFDGIDGDWKLSHTARVCLLHTEIFGVKNKTDRGTPDITL